MRIYTRTGDTGETGLFGGGRVAKDNPRVAAYGDVDELNSAIGVAASGTTGLLFSTVMIATAATMIAAATIVREWTGSPSNSQPRKTATTGFT